MFAIQVITFYLVNLLATNTAYTSSNVFSFSAQLKALNLVDKKVFVKMDIEGSEYEAFEDILEIHFCDYGDKLDNAITLLSS